MQDVSLYDVLGVDADATPEDIRLAFLGLAHRFHPDLNADDAHEERFKQLRHAYEILSCPDRREIYDRTYDSYATTIRQTAPLNPQDKQARRASESTHQFRTQWLKDKKLSRERWFFVLSAVLSFGIVYWAIHFVPELRRQITETPPHRPAPVEEVVSEPPIPANSLPGVNSDLKQYFTEKPAMEDDSARPTTDDVSVGSPTSLGSAKDSTSNREHDDSWARQYQGAESEWAFPVDEEVPPVAMIPPASNGSFVRGNPQSIPRWSTSDYSTPIMIVPRADAQPGFWSSAPPPARVPLYIGRDPVPSQAELANSYSAVAAAQYPLPSTGYTQNSYAEPLPQLPINSLPSVPNFGGPSIGFGGPSPVAPSYLPNRSSPLQPHPSLINPRPQLSGRNY